MDFVFPLQIGTCNDVDSLVVRLHVLWWLKRKYVGIRDTMD
jgi:hypothetical protein